ncbi:sugar ABC transporter ATP-binding protein [Halotalea alkalilenta]|uniref:ABC transporter n=1 Tax=Halotalea alkalilenta TaxID=376489 RepID=A0A172YHU2_9GAMM|nr:sugar ABC transporter ATP-binding protein [Halotalea alkalilenta]ANF58820.1 ABC transporter [Halotalea alkalilenta]
MSATLPRLEMRGVSLDYGANRVLNEVDFELAGGSVHALVGANGAGKSSLISVLAGVRRSYAGRITIDDHEVALRSPRQTRRHGIFVVQQEVDVALVPSLSVAENIALDAIATSTAQLLDRRMLRRQARELLARLDLRLDVDRPVARLSLAQKQQLLIARALASGCRFLVLDEPTAPLDADETERLLALVAQLKAEGLAIALVSHRLEELDRSCDRISVLRNGRRVHTGEMVAISVEGIAEQMLGRRLGSLFPHRKACVGAPLLEVEGLKDARLKGIDLRLHAGEILGVAGLAGAGKSELCKALFGVTRTRLRRGSLRGRPWRPRSPHRSSGEGIALVPEERRSEGVLIDADVTTNLTLAARGSFSRWGLFDHRAARSWARHTITRLGIRADHERQPLAQLSGGNQQKVAIGKWLLEDAEIYLLDEPTKGIDIHAKQELYATLVELAEAGKGILYASGEFSELLGLCDRICVLRDGRLVAEQNARSLNEERLTLLASGTSLDV